MKTCTFFGHRDTPTIIEPMLRTVLSDLIENHAVQVFYVGNHGLFDSMVRRQLSMFESTHGIRYYVVLAYLPKKEGLPEKDVHTIYPEGLELVPPRYAISKRNLWMLEQSDYVITYVRGLNGGAAQFRRLAQTKGKTVIEL